jgi:hypothetical protein
MKVHWLIRLVHILVSALALGQSPQPKAQEKPPSPPASGPAAPVLSPPVVKASPAPPTPDVVESESYPLPLAERDKVRDLQHEYDQIEIENQKMLVKVEQNKARQSALVDALKLAAFQFSQLKKIDLDQYEFDPAQIRFVKKKLQKP